MLCCAKCFGDPYLEREVIAPKSMGAGLCDYCGRNTDVRVEPDELADRFEMLLDVYEPHNDGEELHDLLSRDWGILTSANLSRASAAALLSKILGDAAKTERYVVRLTENLTPLDQWQAFRRELMQSNRFFPKSPLDLTDLERLLAYLQSGPDTYPSMMYRARTYGTTPHTPTEMGAPPADLCSQGRANPVGIPFLYLASDPQTAASEVRPHTGDGLCVAEFVLSDGLRLVDLRAPMRTVSPFAMPDEDLFLLLYRARPLLHEMGEELTRPVGPRTAAVHYLPTQYLCEFIKKCGFDGVLYRSSVGPGINVALFDPNKAIVGKVSHHRVTQVSVTISQTQST